MLNERELKARYEVALEQYNKTINIEAQLMVLMANRYILPAAYQFAGELAQSVAAMKAAGVVSKETKKTLETVTEADRRSQGAASTSCSSCSSTRPTATSSSTRSTSATR